MTTSAEPQLARFSERVRSAPGQFFPDPVVPIQFNFDQGVPAPESYPIADLASYAARALTDGGISACEYAHGGMEEMGKGYIGLRELIASRVGSRDGRTLDRHNVLLGNGSSNALSLCAAALIDPGDGVVIEALSYPFMVSYLAARGADIRTVPVDVDGMDVDAVEARLMEMKREGVAPKLIYTIATFQVPTGWTMSLERRRRLVQLAAEWDVFVIDDNCYYDTWLDTPPPPTLFSMDDAGVVIQTDSFSKVLAPGLRLGHAVAPSRVIDALAVVREDHGVNQILPRLVESYVADGKLDEHLLVLRGINGHKRDVVRDGLEAHCQPWVDFTVPGGGIYFWLSLSPEVDLEQVRRSMEAEGVACRPGERFSGDDSGRRYLRLAFLPVAEAELAHGVAALGRALRAAT